MTDEPRAGRVVQAAGTAPIDASPAWQSDRAIVAALVVLPLIVLLPAALVRGVFYLHDLQYFFYPYHAMPAELLWRGELPLWNPYAFSGIPLIGDGQTALFYPPNWLFFLLPSAAGLNYAVLSQFSIAGAGMFLFGRNLGASRWPAIIGALAFMFCGFLTARAVHLSIQSGAALIPLVFLCVDRAFQESERPRSIRLGHRRWFAAAAVAVALQAVAGHPQVPVYTALALGLFALVHAVARWRADHDFRWLYRLPVCLAVIYVMGYGLAAIQLAPWIELGSLSPRAAGASFQFVFANSMTGGDWLLMLFPYLNGSLMPTIYADTPQPVLLMVKTWEHTAYVGMLPLGLAALALSGGLRRGNVHTIFFGLLLIGGALFAAGRYTPFAPYIYRLPVVGKLRDVERMMALVDFAVAALAVLGAQRLLAPAAATAVARGTARVSGYVRRWSGGLLIVAAAMVLLPVLLVFLGQQPSLRATWRLPLQAVDNLHFIRLPVLVPLIFAVASAVLLTWWSRYPPAPRRLGLAAGLVLLDMASFAAPFNPLASPQLYARRPDVLAALGSADQSFRKATMVGTNDLEARTAQETLAVSWSMVSGVEDVNGFNSLQPRRYTDYLFGPLVTDVSYGLLNDGRLLRKESPILSALNVRYVLVAPDQAPPTDSSYRQVYGSREVRVYENLSAYPRAFFADSARVETDPKVVLRTVTADGFDGRRLALLETSSAPSLAPSDGPASVTITHRGANRMVLTTDTSAARVLVLSEMYFPGWRATIDGVETPIYRTNYLFRGIVVPAGQHRVEFAYWPMSLMVGAAISFGAVAICGVLLLRRES